MNSDAWWIAPAIISFAAMVWALFWPIYDHDKTRLYLRRSIWTNMGLSIALGSWIFASLSR